MRIWNIDDFLCACWELPSGRYCSEKAFFDEHLEMMSLGVVSSSRWCDIAQSLVLDTYNNAVMLDIKEVYWEPYATLWEDAGVPKDWWHMGDRHEGLTYAELAHAIDVMSGYAEAIESGVPILDVIA